MSDADRMKLSYVEEITFGVTPNSNLQDARFVSESLTQETASVRSNEIRDDRQVTDIIRSDVSAAGELALELSATAYDDLFEAALQSADWSTPVVVGPGVTFSVAAGTGDFTISDSGSGLAGILVNQWVQISGFASSLDNGLAKVTASAAGAITVNHLGNGFTEAAGASVTITMLGQIVNGTEFRSFSFEKLYGDLSNEFEVLRGLAVDGFNLSIVAAEILTGSFTFIGKDAISGASSAGSGNTAAPTNDVMNAIDDIDAIFEGNAAFSATEVGITLANNLRARAQIATLGAISLGSGKCDVSGTLKAYYTSKAIVDKHINFNDSTLAVKILDGNSKGYVIDMPAVNFTAAPRIASGTNTDIIADLTYEAKMHATETVTIRISRIP